MCKIRDISLALMGEGNWGFDNSETKINYIKGALLCILLNNSGSLDCPIVSSKFVTLTYIRPDQKSCFRWRLFFCASRAADFLFFPFLCVPKQCHC